MAFQESINDDVVSLVDVAWKFGTGQNTNLQSACQDIGCEAIESHL